MIWDVSDFLWIFYLEHSNRSWFVWSVFLSPQIFRNTSSEFGKQRSNSLPGLPGTQRRLDGWILDVCETRIPQIVLRIFVVLLGLDMAF